MRIAIAGKGGTGKTTITGTLARAVAQAGRTVLAVDADTNPNLATVLGMSRAQAEALVGLPRDLMQRRVEPDGSTTVSFAKTPSEVLSQYGVEGPDGVRLVVMGKVGHAGSGCLCSAHATIRGLLGEIVAQGDYTGDILVDMEAGLEHLSRGTVRHVTRIVAVLEPYYRSMETASRVVDLANDLGIAEVVAVSNKVRDDADRHAIAEFCRNRGLDLIAEIPHDAGLAESERNGASPIDYSPASPAVIAIRALATRLMLAALCVLPPAAMAQAPMRLVGRSDLGGGGFNGAVAVVGKTAVVGAGIMPAAGIHAQLYSPLPCPAATAKIVDLSAPTNPRVVATIPMRAGVIAQDVAALRVRTPKFSGDLAAIAVALCSSAGNGSERGVVYYDITKPSQPKFLGRYQADADRVTPAMPPCAPAPTGSDERCAASQHSVFLVQRPDGRVLSLSTEPGASAGKFPSGDLRIVDVTNPRSPRQIGAFPPPGQNIFSDNGCRPFRAAHNAQAAAGGAVGMMANYDGGMVVLDLSDPTTPKEFGRFSFAEERGVEGNVGYVTMATVRGRRLGLVSEQDWLPSTTTLVVDRPASLAGVKFACEAVFTMYDPAQKAQLSRQPGGKVSGEIAYVGRGCPEGKGSDMHGDPISAQLDPYLSDPRGRIALIDRGRQPTQPDLPTGSGCSMAERVKRARDAGAIAVIIAQTAATSPRAFAPDGHPAGIDIPVIQIDKVDADAIREVLCPVSPAAPGCVAGAPVSATLNDAPGEWGGLHVVDMSDLAAPKQVAVHRTDRARVYPPPDLGVYSVHHALARGQLAYVAWNSDGLRVLDLADGTPKEIGHFVPPDMPDPNIAFPAKATVVGVALLDTRGRHYVVITDVNSGLYVLEAPPRTR